MRDGRSAQGKRLREVAAFRRESSDSGTRTEGSTCLRTLCRITWPRRVLLSIPQQPLCDAGLFTLLMLRMLTLRTRVWADPNRSGPHEKGERPHPAPGHARPNLVGVLGLNNAPERGGWSRSPPRLRCNRGGSEGAGGAGE